MKLRDLLEPQILNERYRPSDIADILKKSRQVVSSTLNRDLDRVTVLTLRSYLKAVGIDLDLGIVLKKDT